MQVIRAKVYNYSTEAELKCHSSCSPAGSLNYVWFKNGEKIKATVISSYKGLFQPRDNISCALEGHEDFPSPAVCEFTNKYTLTLQYNDKFRHTVLESPGSSEVHYINLISYKRLTISADNHKDKKSILQAH